MSIQTSTLRPGLLVSLNTSVRGNVSYAKEVIEGDHLTESGEKKAKWATERTIVDPAEHEAAIKVRSKVRSLITSVCAASAFGLLCPEDCADKLDRAMSAARKVADDFNLTAKLTRVHVYLIAGRIAPDDVEAVKAINAELRDLMADMEQGLKNCDVKVVREAASKAKELGSMLSPEAAGRTQVAIDAARSACKQIVAAGEQGAQEIDTAAINKIAAMRTMFLDLDEAKEITAPAADARAVDFEPIDPASIKAAPALVPAIEM